MVTQQINKRITAIIPAYNEAERIGAVLEILSSYPHFHEIIVIDDGSTDQTESVVRQYNVRYEKNSENKGKGYSMDRAVSLAQGEILFFCDADISGLTHEVIHEITEPIQQGEVDMFIGMRNRQWYIAHNVLTIVPLLGGERAMTRELWLSLPNCYKKHFRVEAALNYYAIFYGNGFHYKVFPGLSQVIKEKKYGFWKGTAQRWSMMADIVLAQLRLHLVDSPKSVRSHRISLVMALQSVAGMAIGGVLIAASYYGPRNFVTSVFAKELEEDPSAPLVHTLLSMTDVTAVSTIMIIGVIIFAINAATFLLVFPKLDNVFRGLITKINNNKSRRTVNSEDEKNVINKGKKEGIS